MLLTEIAKLETKYSVLENLCYDLYAQDWVNTHISKERQQQSIIDYYEYVIECTQDELEPESYDDYLFDNGYQGEYYACFEEFLECEFTDEEYMAYLLKDFPELHESYKQYQNDCELELALKELDELDLEELDELDLENESEVSL